MHLFSPDTTRSLFLALLYSAIILSPCIVAQFGEPLEAWAAARRGLRTKRPQGRRVPAPDPEAEADVPALAIISEFRRPVREPHIHTAIAMRPGSATYEEVRERIRLRTEALAAEQRIAWLELHRRPVTDDDIDRLTFAVAALDQWQATHGFVPVYTVETFGAKLPEFVFAALRHLPVHDPERSYRPIARTEPRAGMTSEERRAAAA